MMGVFRQHSANVLEKSDLPPAWKNFLLSPLPAVIYGAGRQATVAYVFCLMFRKPVFCLMTTDNRNRWGYLPPEGELPLYLAGEFPSEQNKNELDVIIAINPAHNASVSETLRNSGWSRVTAIADWEETNAVTRDMYFRAYLSGKGGQFSTEACGASHVECPCDGGTFKMYYDIDPIYKANLLGEFGNIVLPSLFDDFDIVGAVGSYEHGGVRLHPGDCVFDLGANVGLFSCVAAAKGCKVHAFEPTPATVDGYLRRNANLHRDFTVVSKAVMDKSGKIEFFVNANCIESLDITRHSIYKEYEPSFTNIEVEATTVDEYVKEHGIDKVDFIKSNTEHAEKYVLRGAAETLRKFSPCVAMYYNVKIDNTRFELKKIFEKALLDANPNYTFEYRWKRLFAWVPGR